MCLAIPVKIIKINDSMAEIEVGGIIKEASLDLIEEAKVGDYVLLHAGFAIQRLSEEDARETLELLSHLEDNYLSR